MPYLPQINITEKAARWIRKGNPWVFDGSITSNDEALTTGQIVLVRDEDGVPLGLALYEKESPIKLRMFLKDWTGFDERLWLRQTIVRSITKRTSILDSSTNACRLIHGENDGMPGLVVDKYEKNLVIKLYSRVWFGRLTQIVDILTEVTDCQRITLRLARNIYQSKSTDFYDGQVLKGDSKVGLVRFKESGFEFYADIILGHKTGFYLDQRENRRMLLSLIRGRRLLNLFSYTGAFGVYGAAGGIETVVDVDISEPALELAHHHFIKNKSRYKCKFAHHHTIKADVFEFLETGRESYDVVVVDPPALAQSKSDVRRALIAYGRLSYNAAKLVRKNGLLVMCSCSAFVPAGIFFKQVKDSIKAARGHFKVLAQTGQPLDHPAAFPEAKYLKAVFAEIY